MNDKGISGNGNKKMSTITGQEEIFDTPIQTVTGEDISNKQGIDVINPIEALFNRSIKVEGVMMVMQLLSSVDQLSLVIS